MSCRLELRKSCPFYDYLQNSRNIEDYYKLCGLCIKAVYAKSRLSRIVVVNTL